MRKYFKKIGLIVHGPEVTDSGGSSYILNIFKNYEIDAKLGGIMGKTAIIDEKVEDKIDINESKKRSEQLDEMLKKEYDLIILLNHGKTLETGINFGGIVISNSNYYSNAIPIVQIERPMEEDGVIFAWNESGKKFLNKLYEMTKIPIYLKPITIPKRFRKESGKNYRKLIGVKPNEKIFLHNVVIGYAKSEDVTIVEKEGKIIDIMGGTINPHGLEKLPTKINLHDAMVKSAKILRNITPKTQRVIEKQLKTNKIAILFNADNVYDIIQQKIDFIISIGDDTTAIIADSASRFKIPILGIIDGDMDCLLKPIKKGMAVKELGNILNLPAHSSLIQVKSGYDDKMGELIQSSIFKGKKILEIKNKEIFEVKEKILDMISSCIVARYEES